MYLRSDERGPAMSNRLALRIALFGGVAVVLFAVLFFRLWLLQVLDGEKYLAEAKNNRTRSYRVSAPRGEILDRNGKVLVANRTSLALQVNPRKLPEDPAERRAELVQLAELTHSTLRRVRRTMHEELKLAPAAPVTLRRDVGHYLVYYLQENQDRFPGVEVQRVFVRDYPDGTLAAHILGNVGEIEEEAAEGTALPRPAAGRRDRPGRGRGHLRPLPARRARADPDPGRRASASRRPTAGSSPSRRRPGDSLKLSIDDEVQAAGEAALAERGLPGGFITMDVHTRRNPRPRLVPDLRTVALHPAADPEAGRRDLPQPGGAADRPGDRRPLPDRLDLQARSPRSRRSKAATCSPAK